MQRVISEVSALKSNRLHEPPGFRAGPSRVGRRYPAGPFRLVELLTVEHFHVATTRLPEVEKRVGDMPDTRCPEIRREHDIRVIAPQPPVGLVNRGDLVLTLREGKPKERCAGRRLRAYLAAMLERDLVALTVQKKFLSVAGDIGGRTPVNDLDVGGVRLRPDLRRRDQRTAERERAPNQRP